MKWLYAKWNKSNTNIVTGIWYTLVLQNQVLHLENLYQQPPNSHYAVNQNIWHIKVKKASSVL